MNDKSLRNQFRSIRATLLPYKREEWEDYQVKLQELETPPTPLEWVQQIKRFADEQRRDMALDRWVENRHLNPHGWGEDDPNQIKGWSEATRSGELVEIGNVKRP